MYHSFFILSSVDRHLGCLHVLLIVNSAAMKTGYMCLGISHFFPLMSLSNGWLVLFIFRMFCSSLLFLFPQGKKKLFHF